MLDPQIGDAQFRQAAAAHQQGHPGRHIAQEKTQRGYHLTVIQQLELIEHQQQRRMLGRQFGEQMGQQGFETLAALLGQQQAQRAAVFQLAVERVQQVAAELARLVIAGMQLQPGDLAGKGLGPLAGQGGFAEAARRLQQHQAHFAQARQPFVQTRAGEQSGRQGRHIQFRGNQRQSSWHGGIHDRFPFLIGYSGKR